MELTDIINAIVEEKRRAESIHPRWPKDPVHAAGVIGEESGELMQASLDYSYDHGNIMRMRDEAIQTGAMAIRFLEHLEEYERRQGY